MDTLTHALAGALIGRATRSRDDPLPVARRMAAGFLTAAFPDVDFVASYLAPLSYLHNHRGITHSILLMPLWAALLAVVLAAVWRSRPPWRAYYGIAALGVTSHIALDLITSFGTMILAPFSDARYALGTTFIIDPWFSGILVAGLLACWRWRSARTASFGLAALAAYVLFQFVAQQEAIEFGRAHARAEALYDARVSAIPRPVSPFNWTVVIAHGDRYRYAHVNLARRKVRDAPGPDSGFISRLNDVYRPLNAARWTDVGLYGESMEQAALAKAAYSDPAFRFFRWFAAYPALLSVEAGNPERCAWFHDLRFVTPGREPTPFRYGMCREGEGPWQPYQLMGGGKRPVY